MGEIRIKSGNLFDINGDYSAYMHQGSPTCRVDNGQIIVNVVPYYFAHIKFSALIPSGQYTIKCKASANFRGMRLLLTKPFDTGTWNESYQRYYADMVKNDNYYTYTFTVDEDFAIGFAISGTTGDTGTIDEIMLNKGSTAFPYQPYFLNRPAHQFVNNQCIDIPTHHFINGRWQGELTSQSPLKFRADGEMLDWRVEGKTSGNLFDIRDTYSAVPSTYDISNDTISMVLISDWGSNFIKFSKTYKAGTYTFRANITKDPDMTINLWSNKPFVGSSYNNYYEGYIRSYNGSLQTYTFSEDFRIGFTGSGANGKSGNISDFQILSGTYTSSTIPPYEPYGGVGDWDETEQRYRIPVTVNGVTTNLYTDHQLLDGDSIDFAADQTAIPIATGNNILTVDTAVQPSKVFVKFEG